MLIRQNILYLLTVSVFTVCLQATLAGEADTGDLLRGGGNVFSQSPTRLGGLASDTEFFNDSGLSTWQQEADQFLLSDSVAVRQISWWGFYGSNFGPSESPPATEVFRVRFYDARIADGLPGSILYEEQFSQSGRTSTGSIVQSVNIYNEYSYKIALSAPLQLSGNITYWLEIVQVGDLASHFRWESGFGSVNGHAFLDPFGPDWRSSSGSFAFQLSTVPEPATLGILLFGFGLTGFKPKRRRR